MELRALDGDSAGHLCPAASAASILPLGGQPHLPCFGVCGDLETRLFWFLHGNPVCPKPPAVPKRALSPEGNPPDASPGPTGQPRSPLSAGSPGSWWRLLLSRGWWLHRPRGRAAEYGTPVSQTGSESVSGVLRAGRQVRERETQGAPRTHPAQAPQVRDGRGMVCAHPAAHSGLRSSVLGSQFGVSGLCWGLTQNLP